jgi:hypothetical protein
MNSGVPTEKTSGRAFARSLSKRMQLYGCELGLLLALKAHDPAAENKPGL